jgi:predicted TIM-barrel fold metal-dependent hydrolase
MTVVDVDSHFEIAVSAEDHPLYALRESFPSNERFLAQMVGGNLLELTPTEDAPPDALLASFLPEQNRSSGGYATLDPPAESGFASLTAEDGLAWMDKVGIDFSLINPGGIGILAATLTEHRAEALRLSNTFLAEYLAGHTDRMAPVTMVDWRDLDAGIAELTRMRAAGSRAFWIRAEPFGDKSPAHPDLDRIWSAATDLGMVAILHVGNAPVRVTDGWANVGWNQPGGGGPFGFFRLAAGMSHQDAELMLASMVYGGVFGRHPNLTVITEELGIDWLPYLVRRIDRLSMAGPWPYDHTPSEMVRRNVRATPLAGLGDPNPLTSELVEISEMLVFSSDYPHGEGNGDPIALLEPSLKQLTTQGRAAFLGGTMADCFARMGDPLPR